VLGRRARSEKREMGVSENMSKAKQTNSLRPRIILRTSKSFFLKPASGSPRQQRWGCHGDACQAERFDPPGHLCGISADQIAVVPAAFLYMEDVYRTMQIEKGGCSHNAAADWHFVRMVPHRSWFDRIWRNCSHIHQCLVGNAR